MQRTPTEFTEFTDVTYTKNSHRFHGFHGSTYTKNSHRTHRIHRSLGAFIAVWVWQECHTILYICVNPWNLWEFFSINTSVNSVKSVGVFLYKYFREFREICGSFLYKYFREFREICGSFQFPLFCGSVRTWVSRLRQPLPRCPVASRCPGRSSDGWWYCQPLHIYCM